MKPTDALNSSFIGTVLRLYMFRAAFLPIISSQEQDGTGSSILLLVANGHQICENVPMPIYG